jgi:endo-1,4-beta-xylanase
MKLRLTVVAACAAILVVTAATPAAARTGPVQLGAAVYTDAFLSDPDPRYRATLAGYDSITAETAMKIGIVQPRRGTFDFTAADAMVAFAEAHGQVVFGHTLTWCADSTLPDWLRNGTWSRSSLLAVLEEHITRVMTHFRGRVAAWDVVNEALNDDGTRRDCLWKRVIGDDWIAHAFRFARSVDPAAKLFYNEVRADFANPKYDATVNLVRELRLAGVPVDGAGLQYHLTDRMPTQEQVQVAVRGLADLGVEVHISELDVPVWRFGGTPERRLARQGEVYRAVAAACQAEPACVRITTWGFTDRYTWRLPWQESLPLPFDSEYRPKPGWVGMQEALNPPPPSEPPPPSQPAPPTAQAAAGAPAATAAQASLPTLSLDARLRKQRVRTWLARRALAVKLRIAGTPARVRLVARVGGRVVARATTSAPTGTDRSTPVALTRAGIRILRKVDRVSVVLAAVATDESGRTATAVSRVRSG